MTIRYSPMTTQTPTSARVDPTLCVASMKIGESGASTSAPLLSDTEAVIAPLSVLKEIGKMPFSKSLVSIAVHRSGRTIALSGAKEEPKPVDELVASSLLLCEIKSSLTTKPHKQVTPLTWIEAWLDNVMVNVPELVFCCDAQGHKLLSADADAPAFDPHVADVLRFLLSHCKEDPGVYWLYKSADEGDETNEITLYDLSTASKEHSLSSSPSPLPQVFLACAHEQFARRILSNEDEFHLTSESNSAQGTSSAISSKLAAIRHVSEAIKSMQKLQGDIRQWLPTSRLDKKMWSLILLLGESYLSLGEAYKDNQQLQLALDTVKLACSTYGSMPHKYEEALYESTLYKSFSQQSKFIEMEDAEPGACDISLSPKELPSSRLFWAKVWLLVGQVHEKCTIQREKQALSPLELPSEAVVEVDRLEKKLKVSDRRCASCLLVNCSCVARSNKKAKKLPDKAKFVRGGIFMYLNRSNEKDYVGNMLTAIHCFKETQRALEKVPASCDEFRSVVKRRMVVWNEIGRYQVESKRVKESEGAFDNAIAAAREISHYHGLVTIYLNAGHVRRSLALEIGKKLESKRTSKSRKEAVESAITEYSCSLRYYLSAKKEVDLAIEKDISVPEDLKSIVYTQLGQTYYSLGELMSEEDTTVAATLISDTPLTGRWSSHDVIEKVVLKLYNSLGETRSQYVGDSYYQLGVYFKDRCNCLLKRLPKGALRTEAYGSASSADRMWEMSLQSLDPEKYPSKFVACLVERTDFLFSFSQPQSNTVLESVLSRFLEVRHISSKVELGNEFWLQLQKLLKAMLSLSLKEGGSKTGKLRGLYSSSLRPESCDLNAMCETWTSDA